MRVPGWAVIRVVARMPRAVSPVQPDAGPAGGTRRPQVCRRTEGYSLRSRSAVFDDHLGVDVVTASAIQLDRADPVLETLADGAVDDGSAADEAARRHFEALGDEGGASLEHHLGTASDAVPYHRVALAPTGSCAIGLDSEDSIHEQDVDGKIGGLVPHDGPPGVDLSCRALSLGVFVV